MSYVDGATFLKQQRAAAVAKLLKEKSWGIQALSDQTAPGTPGGTSAPGHDSGATERPKKWATVPGISEEEKEQIRSRGPEAQSPTVPTRSRQTYDPANKLGGEYAGEEQNQKFRGSVGGEMRTVYYRDEEQDRRKLTVGKTGLTRKTTDGEGNLVDEVMDTEGGAGGMYHGGEGGKEYGQEIFVMDKEGQLFASNSKLDKQRVNKDGHDEFMHHSSLNHGDEVRAAGEMTVKKGVVTDINDSSGHYRPSSESMADAVNEMEAQGVPMIDEDGKRATVTLKGERFAGDRKTDRVMDFERFSQTGGNLEQIDSKQDSVEELNSFTEVGRARNAVNEARRAVEKKQQKIADAKVEKESEGYISSQMNDLRELLDDLRIAEEELEEALRNEGEGVSEGIKPSELLAQIKKRNEDSDGESAEDKKLQRQMKVRARKRRKAEFEGRDDGDDWDDEDEDEADEEVGESGGTGGIPMTEEQFQAMSKPGYGTPIDQKTQSYRTPVGGVAPPGSEPDHDEEIESTGRRLTVSEIEQEETSSEEESSPTTVGRTPNSEPTRSESTDDMPEIQDYSKELDDEDEDGETEESPRVDLRDRVESGEEKEQETEIVNS